MEKESQNPNEIFVLADGARSQAARDAIKKIPRLPGVYIMKDATDQIIYIGKAIDLKRRVSGYFQNNLDNKNLHPKIKKMVLQIRSFEIHTVDTELEALITECMLIKQHKPTYNALLKYDAEYPYIKITNEMYPRLCSTNILHDDGSSYYGPYRGAYEVEEMVSLIRRLFKIRSCTRSLDGSMQTPCLNFHVGQCGGPCCQGITPSAYQSTVDAAIRFIRTGESDIMERLSTEMRRASDSLDFETAARLRNEINSLNTFLTKQRTVQAALKDEITIAFARSHMQNAAQVYLIDGGLLSGKVCVSFDQSPEAQQKAIADFLAQHLDGKHELSSTPPDSHPDSQKVLQKDIDEIIIIQGWLAHGGKRQPGGLMHLKINKNGSNPYQDALTKSIEIWQDFSAAFHGTITR